MCKFRIIPINSFYWKFLYIAAVSLRSLLAGQKYNEPFCHLAKSPMLMVRKLLQMQKTKSTDVPRGRYGQLSDADAFTKKWNILNINQKKQTEVFDFSVCYRVSRLSWHRSWIGCINNWVPTIFIFGPLPILLRKKKIQVGR